MKKDKAFAEKGSVCGVGWHIGYEPLEPMTKEPWPHMTVLLDRSAIYIDEKAYKDLRKFIKALKKGLRRLERG